MTKSSEQLSNRFDQLCVAAKAGLLSSLVTDALASVVECGLKALETCRRQELQCDVPGKQYFSFLQAGKLSRPINTALFDAATASQHLHGLLGGQPIGIELSILQRTLYTAVMAYCATNDLLKRGDQKTPGTFFEIFCGHLLARRFGVNPTRSIQVLNLDMETKLPTDLIFDLGPSKARLHVPIKTSTRERVIQVWAHQRVLDGVFGVGRFRGVLVCLAETNAKPNYAMTEVCLPGQWAIYQMFIAQMHRVYYLDPPTKYLQLGQVFPFIPVKTFAEFFSEADRLVMSGPGA